MPRLLEALIAQIFRSQISNIYTLQSGNFSSQGEHDMWAFFVASRTKTAFLLLLGRRLTGAVAVLTGPRIQIPSVKGLDI